MTPATTIRTTTQQPLQNQLISDCNTLFLELDKGVQSMKKGDVYTIEDAWEEIDKI